MNTQKKQLMLATITVLFFCAVVIAGFFLIPMKSSSATSRGDDYPESPAPSYVVAPKKVDGLVYNGRPQALITAGQDGITYSLDKTNFTSRIPTALNAGAYFVYYKLADDEVIYSLYSSIAQKERTVSCTMKDWNCAQTANEPMITLSEADGTTEPQITYYQDGRKLYRKPTAVGRYTVEVSVPASTNYRACTTTQDFAITSQIELLFDASLVKYKNVVVKLGTQTQTVDLTLYSRTKIFNSLNGTQTLTVTTTDGKEIFSQRIDVGQNQQIKVKG